MLSPEDPASVPGGASAAHARVGTGRRRLVQVCAISRTERISRWAIAVMVSATAVSAYGTGTWALAIPATAAALLLLMTAITGWCPSLPTLQTDEPVGNDMGVPEARQHIDTD